MLLTYILFTSYTYFAANIFNKDILKREITEKVRDSLMKFTAQNAPALLVNAGNQFPFTSVLFTMFEDFCPQFKLQLAFDPVNALYF